jgi:hypothetical protein
MVRSCVKKERQVPFRQLSIGIARESSWNGGFNDNFRIELEDDELQREEMDEKEMEEMEMEEKEKEKEREEDVEVEQREEGGGLPFRVPKPPFSNQQGFYLYFLLVNQ